MSALIERIVALTALAGLVIFVGVLVGFVAELDLTIVVVAGLSLACYDFYQALFRDKSADD